MLHDNEVASCWGWYGGPNLGFLAVEATPGQHQCLSGAHHVAKNVFCCVFVFFPPKPPNTKQGYSKMSLRDIAHKLFSYADGCTFSGT